MKQRIDKEQVLSLTDEQKVKLRELWEPKEGDFFYFPIYGECYYGEYMGGYSNEAFVPNADSLPLLSIGQMIEILHRKNLQITLEQGRDYAVSFFLGFIPKEYRFQDKELCDALWEALKEVL